MTNGVLGRGMRFLITAIALVGLLFAALLLSASIAVIGFKFSAALSYGLAVLVIWTVLEALERFGSAFFRKYEPWLIMAFFLLLYLVVMQLAPEVGQRRMPYDSLRAQKSLESGHIAFYRPQYLYYWINYDFVLSVLGIVFSPKLIVGQILNAVCRAVTLYPIFRLSERMSGRRVARLVTLVTALSPALIVYSTTLVGDFLSAMFYLYAVYFFLVKSDWERFSANNIVLWLVVGFLFGLGYLFKTVSFLYAAALGVFIVLRLLSKCNIRVTLLLCASVFSIGLAFNTVKSIRTDMFVAAREMSGIRDDPGPSFWSGVLREVWLGLCIDTGGSYSPNRDRAFGAATKEKKIEMVKNMLVNDMKRYPQFFVYKFKRVWGSNDSLGSILYWFRASCQKDCYKPRDKNYCPKWLAPLLRAEHLMVSFLFFLGALGFLLSTGRRRQMDFWIIGSMSMTILLSYAVLSMVIESHGRYRTVVYPFFFMVIPYICVWFEKDNPIYVRIGGLFGWLRKRIKGRHER